MAEAQVQNIGSWPERQGSFLASKNRCWPWTIYVYRASTDEEVKIVIGSLWNCPINCGYYSIPRVKIFKEVVGGEEVLWLVSMRGDRHDIKENPPPDKYRVGSRYLPIQRQRMRIYGIPQDTEDRSPSVFFRVMENTWFIGAGMMNYCCSMRWILSVS